MKGYLDTLEIELPAQTEAGKLRQQALSQLTWTPTPAGMVSYVSSNRVLIIAELELARRIEAQLPEKMQAYLAISASESSVSSISNAWNVSALRVQGYLGRFEAFIESQPAGESLDELNLGLLFNIANGLFDQVIDCSPQALITAEIKPPGYYHLVDETQLLEEVVAQVAELIGEFEKPRYFSYDPDICAHGNSGITGCTRCIDACPTQAIISIGDKVQVNPHLCQGGGSCASSCPSGAISYTYPNAQEQIELLRLITQTLRSLNDHQEIPLLIYDNEHGSRQLAQTISGLPEQLVPFLVEDIGSVGLDLLASALAYGASPVFVYLPQTVAGPVAQVASRNIELLNGVLQQLQLDRHRIEIISDLQVLHDYLLSTDVFDSVATFSAVGNKRNTIRAALAHLNSLSAKPRQSIPLPEGSLFGQIEVNKQTCTLCMACVSVCPGRALQDGGEHPALKFIEANCLQCGICSRACPEEAISLQARVSFEQDLIHSARTVNKDQPFHCLRCGKPFATKSMIDKMTGKLEGHWMFQDSDALNRLKMCEDCRVIDMFDGQS